MLTKEVRETRGTLWLQHWRECEASGEGMAAYSRRHGLNADEGYRWKRILRRAQRWPMGVEDGSSGALPVPARNAVPKFARVRIAATRPSTSSVPLRLSLQLGNGRRAELMIEDEGRLPRVLSLLEQPG